MIRFRCRFHNFLFFAAGLSAGSSSAWAMENTSLIRYEEHVRTAESSSSYRLRALTDETGSDEERRNLIENIELRYGKSFETEEKRTTSLKISPRGVHEFQKWGDVRNQAASLRKLAKDHHLNQSRFDRTKDYLDFWHQSEKMKLFDKKLDLAEKTFQITKIGLRGGVTNSKDLLQAQQEVSLNRLAVEDQKDHLLLSWQKIKLSNTSLPEAPQSPQTLRDLPNLLNHLKTFADSQTDSSNDKENANQVALLRLKSDLLKSEVDLSLASKTKMIQSFEVKLSEDRREKVYSVEMGFNLPGFSDDPEIQEKRRKIIDSEIDTQSASSSYQIQKKVLLVGLKQSIRKLELIEKTTISEQKLRGIMRQQDPLLEIRFQKSQLDSESDKIDKKYSALLNYFTYLHHTDGFISTIPSGLWE